MVVPIRAQTPLAAAEAWVLPTVVVHSSNLDEPRHQPLDVVEGGIGQERAGVQKIAVRNAKLPVDSYSRRALGRGCFGEVAAVGAHICRMLDMVPKGQGKGCACGQLQMVSAIAV